jgi:hypothetical protein
VHVVGRHHEHLDALVCMWIDILLLPSRIQAVLRATTGRLRRQDSGLAAAMTAFIVIVLG